MVGMALTGCTASSAEHIKSIADALNERHVSHCLFLQAGVPPYGHITLLAGSGDWDCVAYWEKAGRPPL